MPSNLWAINTSDLDVDNKNWDQQIHKLIQFLLDRMSGGRLKCAVESIYYGVKQIVVVHTREVDSLNRKIETLEKRDQAQEKKDTKEPKGQSYVAAAVELPT